MEKKKRELKRKLLGGLSVVVALTTLAACSSNGGESAQPADTGKSTPKAAPAKLRVGITNGNQVGVDASPDINQDKYIKKMEEFTNTDLTIELIPWKDYAQKMTLLFAGGDLPDLLQIQGLNAPEVAPAFQANVFLPLNELIEKHAPNLKAKLPKEYWTAPTTSKDGTLYAIPREMGYKNGTVTYLRKDWLDKLNLKTPKTIDEYLNVLRAFRDKDPNGNGKKDEIPFSARPNFTWAEPFFGAYDVNIGGWKYVNGQFLPNYIRPEMKDALKLYRLLYEEKLIDNEFFVQQATDWDAKVTGQAIVGMWQHIPNYPDNWLNNVRKGDPKAELVIAPSPVGPDGKGGANLSAAPLSMAYAIPKSSKDPVAAIKMLDWFYSDAAARFITYGIEGDGYTLENGKVKYSYPSSQAQITDEAMRFNWVRFIGPDPAVNKEYVQAKPNGKLILEATDVANAEGRLNEADAMPNLPTLTARPELGRNGLFLETAAKIITGKESVDSFDKFVDDWKKRGGDQLIKEGTDWYKAFFKK